MEPLVPPAVVLVDPKYPHNVGNALRACACYGLSRLVYTGSRIDLGGIRRLPREERMKGYRSVEWENLRTLRAEDVRGTTPVAVELHPGAESLVSFEHP